MTVTTVRPVRPGDVPAVVRMVHELAEFERAPQDCKLREEQLEAALFGPAPALFGHVASTGPGPTATGTDGILGFALWFLNYSTWEGVHGIYLEDLYVRPEARGAGVGRQLLATLAAHCVEHGYARLDWSVLDWNPARRLYDSLGGRVLDQWVPYRLSGTALRHLAATGTTGAGPVPGAAAETGPADHPSVP